MEHWQADFEVLGRASIVRDYALKRLADLRKG